MINRKYIKTIPWVLFILLGGFHFLSLDLYPLPWFDEVYFASISNSFLKNENFIPEVVQVVKGEREALAYGPVYFWLTSSWIKFTSLSSFNFRFISFFFGVLSTLVLFRITKSKWALLLLLDPFFSICLHHARMETTAVFFILSVFYLIKISKIEIASLIFTLAFLTTPRVFIFMPAFLLFMFLGKVEFKKVVISCSIFISLYTSWIILKFESFSNWFTFYASAIEGNSTAVSGFLWGELYIPKHEYLLIIIAFISVSYKVAIKSRLSNEVITAIFSVVTFYVFVKDWGYYSSLIIPLYYLIILGNLCDIKHGYKRLLLTPLLTIGVVYIGYKSQLLNETDFDLKKRSEEELFTHFKKGDKLIGPARFYYLAKEKGCDYQLFDKFGSAEECISNLTTNYEYDYIISEPSNGYLKEYLKWNNHVQLMDFKMTNPKSILFSESFDFVLYKRYED